MINLKILCSLFTVSALAFGSNICAEHYSDRPPTLSQTESVTQGLDMLTEIAGKDFVKTFKKDLVESLKRGYLSPYVLESAQLLKGVVRSNPANQFYALKLSNDRIALFSKTGFGLLKSKMVDIRGVKKGFYDLEDGTYIYVHDIGVGYDFRVLSKSEHSAEVLNDPIFQNTDPVKKLFIERHRVRIEQLLEVGGISKTELANATVTTAWPINNQNKFFEVLFVSESIQYVFAGTTLINKWIHTIPRLVDQAPGVYKLSNGYTATLYDLGAPVRWNRLEIKKDQ